MALDGATYSQIADRLSAKVSQDCANFEQRLLDIEAEEKTLDVRRAVLQDMEQKIVAMTEQVDEVIELNVGGQPMSTSRAVLQMAEGSLLAGMFSGSFDDGQKRDKEGRVFLDVDPPLFAKVLSHLRLRRVATAECPAPLPTVPEELTAEYDMMVKFFGLEPFMYRSLANTGNIFTAISEMARVCQGRLQTNDLVKITLSTTGGVPAPTHEEVLGPAGFHERSLENSYGAHPSSVTIRFPKHRVRVEGMELRAKVADLQAHMSSHWEFVHGANSERMSFPFARTNPATGRLPLSNFGPSYVDQVQWKFPRDFCLEHIVLFGTVIPKS